MSFRSALDGRNGTVSPAPDLSTTLEIAANPFGAPAENTAYVEVLRRSLVHDLDTDNHCYCRSRMAPASPTRHAALSPTPAAHPSVPLENSSARVLDAPSVTNDYYHSVMARCAQGGLLLALHDVLYWMPMPGVSTEAQPHQPHGIASWGAQSAVYAVAASPFIDGSSLCATADGTLHHVRVTDSVMTTVAQFTPGVQQDGLVASGPLDACSGAIAPLSAHCYAYGCNSGAVRMVDTRCQRASLLRAAAHADKVCSVATTADGSLCASGGNDDQVHVWSLANPTEPVYTVPHDGAVRALAWQTTPTGNILASGGGNLDYTIAVSDVRRKELLWRGTTGAQVCQLAWSAATPNVLLSSHGFGNEDLVSAPVGAQKAPWTEGAHVTSNTVPHNAAAVWEWAPNSQRLRLRQHLRGHFSRVLHLTQNTTGTTVVTAAGGTDETLRVWDVSWLRHRSPTPRRNPFPDLTTAACLR